MSEDLLRKYDYYLKWKDVVVLRFDIYKQNVDVINRDYLPMCISSLPDSFDMIVKFCSDRILMLNREYCKEILVSCGIEDQSPVMICIICKALSFRDNYWIDLVRSQLAWRDVNLYNNVFSTKIAKVSLTGKCDYVKVGDDLFTGELTNKGTRAKCFIRMNDGIFLLKNETTREITMEVISFYIARAIGICSSVYFLNEFNGYNCSVCQILTNESDELIPYRDVVSAYDGNAYNFVMSVDAYNFILMQIFDYVTLNVDRNRDNFGLLRKDGCLVSLYPLFDHDSCFKGRGTNAIYFPTGLTFNKTLGMLKNTSIYKSLNISAIKTNLKSDELKSYLLKYLSSTEYSAMIHRVENL